MRLILCVVALLGVAVADEGRLFVSKQLMNKYVVQGKDFTIKYGIYNIGEAAAIDITLQDKSFDESFAIKHGNIVAHWLRIPPGGNVTHIAVLTPLSVGAFNITPAVLSYRPSEDVADFTTGLSSGIGEVYVGHSKEFDRLFSMHLADWAVFAAMVFVCLAFPYMLYNKSATKYEQLRNKEKKN